MSHRKYELRQTVKPKTGKSGEIAALRREAGHWEYFVEGEWLREADLSLATAEKAKPAA